jgi:hypothetical protein
MSLVVRVQQTASRAHVGTAPVTVASGKRRAWSRCGAPAIGACAGRPTIGAGRACSTTPRVPRTTKTCAPVAMGTGVLFGALLIAGCASSSRCSARTHSTRPAGLPSPATTVLDKWWGIHAPVATLSIRAGPPAAQSAADASRIEHTHVHGAKWVSGTLFGRRPRQDRRLRLDPATLKGDNSDSGDCPPFCPRGGRGDQGWNRMTESEPVIQSARKSWAASRIRRHPCAACDVAGSPGSG